MSPLYHRDNIWTKVEGISPSDETILDHLISAPIKNRWFSPKMRAMMRSGMMDDREHLYDSMRKRFPTGLFPMVFERFPGEVIDNIGNPPKYKPIAADIFDGITLQDWQMGAVNNTFKMERGLWWMATNAGKTEAGAALCKAYHPYPVLWLVHKKDLFLQTMKRLEMRLKEKIGFLRGNQAEDGRVVVAMVQTIPWRKKVYQDMLAGFRILIGDEVHHAAAKSWYRVALSCRKARIRVGMSGTPFSKEDPERNLKMMSAFGTNIMAEIRNKELIESGWSAKPIIHIHRFSGVPNGLDWQPAFDLHIHDSKYNTAVVKTTAEYANNGHICLVLTDRVQHGLFLRDMFAGEGLEAKFISGRDPALWREAKLDQARGRGLNVLVATNILDEGVDVPSFSCLAMAGVGKNYRQVLQRIGRVLRKKSEGENVAHILDWEPRTNYYLMNHALERQGYYKDEGFEVIRETEATWGRMLKEMRDA
jgi:superfamily II DNA or RNA helicase